MRDDKLLCASHESAHRVVARHLGADWSSAWIWRAQPRWDGLCRHSAVDPSLNPLIAAAGGAAEGLLHGKQHPSDLREFVMAEDAAAMGDDLEGALKYAQFVLAGQRRAEWIADTGRLYNDLRIGEWRRSRHPPPPEWMAADKALAAEGMKQMSGATQYQNDADCFSKINAFLRDKLSPEDLSTAEDLLDALVAELAGDQTGPSLASDAAVRQRQRAAFVRRFPNAGRLSTRYG